MIEQYWISYSPKLLYFLQKRINDKEVARDLLQDTFQKALLNKDQLDKVENPEAWLMRVAKNTLIDYTRKKKEVTVDNLQIADAEDHSSSRDHLVEGISECLYELIDEYDEEKRDLLLTVFTRSMTQKEMAEYMDLPYSTLKSRIQKAREHIISEFNNRCCTLNRNSKGEIIGCTPVQSRAVVAC